MSLIVAIDPGLRHCGLAVFDEDQLVHACLVRNPEQVNRGPRAWNAMTQAVLDAYPLSADLLVVELPQYDGRTGHGAAADVFELVGVAGRILAAFAGRVRKAMAVTPAEWKGSIPKKVIHERLFAQLEPEEIDAIEDAGALTHNIYDACALGWDFVFRRDERLLKGEAA